MSDERAGGAPRRKTPWSVLAAAAVVFVICAWMWNELRKDADAVKAERAAAAAKASASGRPQILGLDVIPQEAATSPGAAPAAGSAAPPASATVAASASAAPSSSVGPSTSVAPAARPR